MLKTTEVGNGQRSTRMLVTPYYAEVKWQCGEFRNRIIPDRHEDVHDMFQDLARRGHCVYPYGVSSCDLRYGSFHRFNEIMSAMAKLYKSMHIPKPTVNLYRNVPDVTLGLPYKASLASFNEYQFRKHVIDLERQYFLKVGDHG